MDIIHVGNFSTNATKEDRAGTDDVMEIKVFLLLFYIVIFLMGTIGNILVIKTVLKTQQRLKTSDYFLLQLSTADLMLTVNTMPAEIIVGIFKVPIKEALLQTFLCKFVFPLQTVSTSFSVYSLTCVAYERHRTIVHPLRNRLSKASIVQMITASLLLSIVLALPQAIVTSYNSQERYCHETYPYDILPVIYSFAFLFLQYTFPLLIVSYFYLKIGIALKRSRLSWRKNSTLEMMKRKQQNIRILKLFLVLVITFAICHIPTHVVWLWSDFGGTSEYKQQLFLFAWLMINFNGAIDPLIYGLWGKITKQWKVSSRASCFSLSKCDYKLASPKPHRRNDGVAEKCVLFSSHQSAGSSDNNIPYAPEPRALPSETTPEHLELHSS